VLLISINFNYNLPAISNLTCLLVGHWGVIIRNRVLKKTKDGNSIKIT